MVDVDGSKEVEGVSAVSVIRRARGSGASESKVSSEMREKPSGVRDAG